MSLYNNTWSCSCVDRRLKTFLTSIREFLLRPDEIICSTPSWMKGKTLLLENEEEFCEDPALRMLKVINTPVVIGLFLVVLAGLIIYRSRVRLHAVWNIHPFDRDEYEGEHMDYDLFICCAIDDAKIGRQILRFLEGEGYRVCYHVRDFLPEHFISENIRNSIYRSKRTLCLVTPNFVRSSHCMQDFT